MKTLRLQILAMLCLPAMAVAQSYSPAQVNQIKADKLAKLSQILANQGQQRVSISGAPEQDCFQAIPVTQQVYFQANSYEGPGNVPGEINNAISCLGSGELNDVWYVFTTAYTDTIGFSITPNSPSDDYDWAVFNLTNANCSDIFNDQSLNVSCNFAANLGCNGVTGPNGQNTTGTSCDGQNENLLIVQPGETYVINVSNFSSTQSGYTLEFIGNVFADVAYVQGSVFVDNNGDCVQDANDPAYANGIVSLDINGSPAYVSTNANGDYSFWFSAPNSVNVSAVPPLYHNLVCPASGSYSASLNVNDVLDADFAFQPIAGMNDLVVDIVSNGFAVPGFPQTYFINYANVGTTVLNADLDFTYDALETLISSSVAPTSSAGTTLSWSLGTLNPMQGGQIEVVLLLDSTIVIDSLNPAPSIGHSANIFPQLGDETINNNTDVDSPQVVSSYDPNLIVVNRTSIQEDEIADNLPLEYTIHFQNEGSYYASTVVVRDPLDISQLEMANFQLLSSSHPVQVVWNNSNHTLEFRFVNIMLDWADNNEAASHGYVKYRINHSQNLVVNDVIENQAGIYFDFNPVVETNTAQTVIEENKTTAIEIPASNLFRAYPNPAKGSFTLDYKGSKSCEVTIRDIQGRSVASYNTGSSQVVDTKNWKSGVYVISANDGSHAWTQKLVVE